MNFQIDVEREDDGRWIAEITDLRGVMAYGPREDEAKAVAEALALRVTTEARRLMNQQC